MDTIYMKERTYRLVETLRRENKREQRRLDDKLFSKQGLAASHQMELSALTEEQRRVRQELNRIKKSSSTTWGLLPPRQGEPDYDEQLLWELSNKRNKTEKAERARRRSQRRPLEPTLSESDFSFDSALHHSDPGPSPMAPEVVVAVEVRRPRKLRKRSQQQLDQENRRTEETLKKFNEVFPSDGTVGAMQLVTGGTDAAITDSNVKTVDEADGFGAASLPLFPSQREKYVKGRRETLPNRPSAPIPGNTNPSADNFVRRMSTGALAIIHGENQNSQKSTISLTGSGRRESTTRTSLVGRRESSTIGVPRALQILNEERLVSDSNSDPRHQQRKNAAAVQLYPVTVVDVQEARDNIVRRLVGSTSTTSSRKVGTESPRAVRTLSPIREQKTELNLASASMPEFTNYNDMQQSSTGKQTQKNKRKGDEDQAAPKFDSYKYNPDGTIRTMHLLPDFNESLQQAMKARYIRHTERQWFERELNVGQIFAND